MSATTITKTVFFSASRETVWKYLTDKDKLGEWFHPATKNLAAGQEYELTGQNHDGTSNKICWGEVETFNPPAELVYSFTVGPLGGQMTKVRWVLEEVGGGTRLTLEHSGLETSGDAYGIVMALDNGWDQHFGKLRGLLKAA